jgi:hypothetical protein
MTRQSVQIVFDDNNQVRLLNPDHYEKSKELGEECHSFDNSKCNRCSHLEVPSYSCPSLSQPTHYVQLAVAALTFAAAAV